MVNLYQQGGNFSSLFVSYKPTQYQSSRPQKVVQKESEPKEDKKDDGKITEKDFLVLLKDINGLPSDMQNTIRQASKLFNNAKLLGEEVDASDLSNAYFKVLLSLKNASYYKEDYNTTVEVLKSNSALSEIAVTGNNIIAKEKDDTLKAVPISEYLKNSKKYNALTYGNILWMRANLPLYSGRNDILKIIEGGYGMEKIAKLIKDNISELGTTTTKYDGWEYSKEGQVIKGVQLLQGNNAKELINSRGFTVDGFYKTTIYSKDQKEQIKSALMYAYTMLPPAAQATLQLKGGNANNPEQGALTIVAQLLGSTGSSNYEITWDYDTSDLNKGIVEAINGTAEKTKKDKEKEELEKLPVNTPMKFLAGYGNPTSFDIIYGNTYTGVVGTQTPITNIEDKPISSNSTLSQVVDGNFKGILDISHARIGNLPLNVKDFDKVLIPDTRVVKIDLPIDGKGNPDLGGNNIKKVVTFKKQAKTAGIDLDDPQSVVKYKEVIDYLLKENKLPSAYDSEGRLIGNKWRTFAVLQGQIYYPEVEERELATTYDTLREITDDTEVNNYISKIQQINKTELGIDEQNWFGGESEISRFFEGTIFIPIDINYVNATLGTSLNSLQLRSVGEQDALLRRMKFLYGNFDNAKNHQN